MNGSVWFNNFVHAHTSPAELPETWDVVAAAAQYRITKLPGNANYRRPARTQAKAENKCSMAAPASRCRMQAGLINVSPVPVVSRNHRETFKEPNLKRTKRDWKHAYQTRCRL